jgi:hypothetical protein
MSSTDGLLIPAYWVLLGAGSLERHLGIIMIGGLADRSPDRNAGNPGTRKSHQSGDYSRSGFGTKVAEEALGLEMSFIH